ncbi:hypothetical protein WJX81_008458 [Elliptochloris bilobata]|uniref:Rab-GAP TBC domain-containing protein n=1 Tax=Elliptochloris bilobata TaxID=381761 RepID=A0AAW1RKG3_9CHLO
MAGGTYEARIRRFRGDLAGVRVDLGNLRRVAVHGIPDRDGLRAVAWKLLLGYLPPETARWPAALAHKRAAYAQFCVELIVDPKDGGGGGAGRDGSGGAAPAADHPLSQSQDSRWHAFFKDAEMMEQIDRDVLRTHPDMHFFSGDDGSAVQHRAEMKRCLFVFAKLNPGLRYVQGMNELLAPLYYHFRTDPAPGAAAHAEADAFYCFMDLLAEFRDHFCQQLDNSAVGIRATLTRLSEQLCRADEQLWQHLVERNKVNPQFYAFRWITLLLTQEFPFPDAVRLWDTLFADSGGRTDCLLRVCTAMLLNVREELLQGDFAHNLKLLQRYPSVDVHTVLHRAEQLRAQCL